MSGVELAFFACTLLTLGAWVACSRGRNEAWLWWSGVPLALLLSAPIAAWALVSVGAASFVMGAPRRRGEGEGAAKGIAWSRLRLMWPALVLGGSLAWVLVSTLARQVVTAGATAEEAPQFGQMAPSVVDPAGASWLVWIGLSVAAVMVATSVARPPKSAGTGKEAG